MSISKPSKALVQTTFAAVITTLMIGGLAANLCSAEPQTGAAPAGTNSVAAPVEPKRTLTGAELYSMHCNRCHPERYPTERTAANWKTIVLHMQIRANIPVGQARMILKYLQDNSGR